MNLLPEVEQHRIPENPVDNLFLNRWSPRAFSSQPIGDDLLASIFEAARWAPSSFNEQPWRFIVAKTPADLEKFHSFLLPGNLAWAKNVPVLVVTLAKKTFTHNGKPNRVAVHDLGAASSYMALAATENGLHAHGMAGFDTDLARKTLGVTDDYEVVAMWALGYQGEASQLPENYRAMEVPSGRRPQSETVLNGVFQEVADDASLQV